MIVWWNWFTVLFFQFQIAEEIHETPTHLAQGIVLQVENQLHKEIRHLSLKSAQSQVNINLFRNLANQGDDDNNLEIAFLRRFCNENVWPDVLYIVVYKIVN